MGGEVVYNELTVTTCMSAPRKALTSYSELPGRMTEALSSFSRAPATRQPLHPRSIFPTNSQLAFHSVQYTTCQ